MTAVAVAAACTFAACDKKENEQGQGQEQKKDVAVTGVTLSKTTAILAMDSSLTLTATVLPDSATNKTVTWESTNPAVASVVQTGLVTAVALGNATITVTTQDGGKTASCAVTVGWSTASMGVASFATGQTWTAGSQTWSDAVQTDHCSNKTAFSGSSDCRSNPGYKGDLFGWAAARSSVGCPDGWRVPTLQDFIDLDRALGGTGNTQTNTVHRDSYLNAWGGAYGGYCYSDGSLYFQGSNAGYWSQSEYYSLNGYHLSFNSGGNVNPQSYSTKSTGQPLRCVR